ncbi:TRAP transporter large permease subunit [Leucobacter sp. wl10]|uniref:TRAP transporter large permease subunit n=1 Tax=Leucobacter sp. wl10 TaxID=2304677 RepID=UPI000E5B166D|nr:TRAP transporter large permease subunit [Leucobacter sp. wl10]RGE19622.1 TRAP transporter large permease subunit [Leucobacter sp. wl10]
MIGVWALVAYIAVIAVWVMLLKRNVAEAMIVGFISTLPFLGGDWLSLGWEALFTAITDEIAYATVMFVFMGYVLERNGVMTRMIDLLNSILGGVKGGPAYVSTVGAAALGSVVHNQAAIAATVGSVTIPWMRRAQLPARDATVVVAGNAGMGITFPFSASMFVLVGSASMAGVLTAEQLVIPLLIGGLWCFLYRLIVTWIIVRRSPMRAMAKEDRLPFRAAFRSGWPTLLLFFAVAVPLLMTTEPLAGWISAYLGAPVGDSVSIIFWIPMFLIAAGMLIGWRELPKSWHDWKRLLADSAPRFPTVGVTVLFAFAGANAVAATGMADQMTGLLGGLNIPLWVLAIAIGVIVILVAAPLSASATMAAVGAVSVLALVSAGVPATTAAVAVLVFSSCEAAVPPGGAPLYVAAGIANVNPIKTFGKMAVYYAFPTLFIGVLIILGVLPV